LLLPAQRSIAPQRRIFDGIVVNAVRTLISPIDGIGLLVSVRGGGGDGEDHPASNRHFRRRSRHRSLPANVLFPFDRQHRNIGTEASEKER
jgi:hypothetical protein